MELNFNKLPDAINASPVNDNFSIFPNDMIRDKNISYKARGILGFLLSNKDGWKTHIKSIQNAGTDGEISIRSGLRELENCGYVLRCNYADEKSKVRGSFIGYTNKPYSINIQQHIDYLNQHNYKARPATKESRKLWDDLNLNHEKLNQQNINLENHDVISINSNKTKSNKINKRYISKDIKRSASSKPINDKIYNRLNKSNTNNTLLKHNRNSKLIVMHWNTLSKPFSKHPLKNYECKSHQNIIKTLLEALNEGYDIECIKEVITIYHKFISTPGIDKEISGTYIGLDQLFRFNNYTKKKIKENPKHLLKGVNSWFKELSQNEDEESCIDYLIEKYGKKLKDNHKPYTKSFKNLFIKNIIEPNRNSFKRGSKVKFSIDDENCFIKASKMFHEYLERNKNKLNLSIPQQRKPNFLIKFIFEVYNENNNAKSYWLISPNLWKKNGEMDKILKRVGYLN